MNALNRYFVAFISLFFSSCITSFQTGQEAATLPKHTLRIGADIGLDRSGAGVRYGFLDNIDAGVYYLFDPIDFQKLTFPPMSADVKWKFLHAAHDHFAMATGLGFGTGVERSLPYDAVIYHSSEDEWYYYGGTSWDSYLPLYISAYFNLMELRFSLNYNPFMVYRFGFYDKIFSQQTRTYDYFFDPMNKVMFGNAASVGMGADRFTFFAGFSIENYLHSTRTFENLEFFMNFGYKIDLSKHPEKHIH